MKLESIFTDALKKLDQGKSVRVKAKSDRYTYENQEDSEYDKDWKPETKEEKRTLSPEGYHRVGDRKEKKEELKGEMDEDTFNETYKEKQISVDSTAIDSFEYDPETELLSVKFQSGSKTYDYPGVPLELVEALLKAPSKGEFFMNNIHDQYSLYRKDHSAKNKKQQKGIKKYIKSYLNENKNNWKKAAKAKAKGDKE